MPREKYQTRLPADTAAEVDDYIEEHDVSQSEAIRRLVESGLDAQDEPADEADGEIHRAAQQGTIISVVIIALLAANLTVSLAALGVI